MALPGVALAMDVTGNYHSLVKELDYLPDPEGQLSIEELLANPAAYSFIPSSESTPEVMFSPVWLRIELNFSGEALDKTYYLFNRVENLYDIRIYRPDGEDGYSEWVTGNDYPVSTRELDDPRYGFRIEPTAQPSTLYIRFIGGPGTNSLPWDLVEKNNYESNAETYYSFDIACLSAIAALLLFNFSIALSLGKREYLFYSAYVGSVMMGLVTLDGLGFYYLWPDSPALNQRALHSINQLSAAMRLLTIMSFVGIAALAPRLNRICIAALVLLAATLLTVSVFGIRALPPYMATISWAIGILLGFVIGVYAIIKRVKLAVPLLFTLLIPTVAALLQAYLTVTSTDISIFTLQIAKVGFVIHVLMFSLCLAAHIKLESESRIMALHDGLTGLPGTALLQEHFDLAANLSRRQGMKTAVFFMDLDGFKSVNDNLGHAVGDQLLVQVANRIRGELRRTDIVARIGGDEFAILLTQVKNEKAVRQIAEKLLASLGKPYLIDPAVARIGASIGIAMFPDEGEDLQSLLKAADKAMYDSKARGKNTYTLASSRLIQHPGQLSQLKRVAAR
jgi:diguanylate cyclase (GGDEF)-like protein